MRKFIVIGLILAALVVGIGVWLSLTTPSSSRGVHAPLSSSQRSLLSHVPADAESFALIPTAAALDAKLRANPITSEPLEEWQRKQAMPPAWAIGGADLVAWKEGSRTSYALQLDGLRAALVRLYLMLGSDIEARWDGDTLLINGAPSPPIAGEELGRILALAERLPPGDAIVVQRETSRGAFPPLPRPVVTSIAIDASTIVLTSRASRADYASPVGPLTARFPQGAMITIAFVSPPRLLQELDRLFGREVSTLLADGGAIAIYGIDTHKLLPRPSGVVVMPKALKREADLAAFRKSLRPAEAMGVESYTAETAGELLLSFDRSSNDRYIKDAFESPKTWPSARWTARIDARRLVPVLEKLGDNPGFRIAAPKLYRSARDLSHWIHYLGAARSIEAAATSDGSDDALEVRISSK